MNKISTIMGC